MVLGVVSLVCWLLMAGPAWLLAGTTGLVGLTLAAVLCVLPGAIVILVLGQLAAVQPMAPLAGSVIRMVFVFAGCLAVQELFPQWGFAVFFLWVILFYVVLLVLETALMVQRMKNLEQPADQSENGVSVSA